MPGTIRYITAGATVRTTRDLVAGDYHLQNTDMGVVLSQANSVCYAPAYSTYQQGKEYGVTNDSDGTVSFVPATGEFVRQRGQIFSSINIPSGESRQFTRETSNNYWIIV